MNLTLYSDPEQVLSVIEKLNESVADKRISPVLEELKSSIESGNVESYNEGIEKLRGLLTSKEAQGPTLRISEKDLEALMVLLSSEAVLKNGDFLMKFDQGELLKLMEELGSEGFLKLKSEEVDLGSILKDLDMEPLKEGTESPLSLPSPPSLGLGAPSPDLTPLNYQALILTLIVAITPLFVFLLIKKRRGVISGIRRVVVRRAIPYGSARERAIFCFKALCEELGRLGYPKESWETHREYSSKMIRTRYSDIVQRAASIYEKAAFSPRELEEGEAEELCCYLEEVRR